MNEFITEDMKLAVKKGAAWLDAYHPGWATKIDLSQLSMYECDTCVIGQAVGDYWSTTANAAMDSGEYAYAWAAEHGFEDPGLWDNILDGLRIHNYYHGLDTLWADEVNNRL